MTVRKYTLSFNLGESRESSLIIKTDTVIGFKVLDLLYFVFEPVRKHMRRVKPIAFQSIGYSI